MSSTTVPDALRDVVTGVAAHPGVPADYLDPQRYERAVAYGWVRVSGTGRVDWWRGVALRGGTPPDDLVGGDGLCHLLKEFGLGVEVEKGIAEDIIMDVRVLRQYLVDQEEFHDFILQHYGEKLYEGLRGDGNN